MKNISEVLRFSSNYIQTVYAGSNYKMLSAGPHRFFVNASFRPTSELKYVLHIGFTRVCKCYSNFLQNSGSVQCIHKRKGKKNRVFISDEFTLLKTQH